MLFVAKYHESFVYYFVVFPAMIWFWFWFGTAHNALVGYMIFDLHDLEIEQTQQIASAYNYHDLYYYQWTKCVKLLLNSLKRFSSI